MKAKPITKTDYCNHIARCAKAFWLHCNDPEISAIDPSAKRNIETGNKVGALAREMFEGYVNVTVRREDGRLDTTAMVINTKLAIEHGVRYIAEAAFAYNGCYCAVDMLERNDDGSYDLHEVKSSTKDDKGRYYDDIAFQIHVLEHCGIKIRCAHLITIDTSYVLRGALDVNGLFKSADVTDKARSYMSGIEQKIEDARHAIQEGSEPSCAFSENCNGCSCWQHCSAALGDDSVFNLYKKTRSFKDALALYNAGTKTFADYLRNCKPNGILSTICYRQADHAVNNRPDYIDYDEIAKFVEEATTDIVCFLDFETINPAIPIYQNSSPYEIIPVQASLHILYPDGTVEHHEFLGDPENDPREDMAKWLCEYIPANSTVFAYNCAYERNRIEHLGKLFPELEGTLGSVRSFIKDLQTPFAKGWYYNRHMGNSFSVKSVLPALFPNNPDLDYHNLDGVHNGEEAMDAYLGMLEMDDKEREETRGRLLKYCKLDTQALVEIWKKLKEITQAYRKEENLSIEERHAA